MDYAKEPSGGLAASISIDYPIRIESRLAQDGLAAAHQFQFLIFEAIRRSKRQTPSVDLGKHDVHVGQQQERQKQLREQHGEKPTP